MKTQINLISTQGTAPIMRRHGNTQFINVLHHTDKKKFPLFTSSVLAALTILVMSGSVLSMSLGKVQMNDSFIKATTLMFQYAIGDINPESIILPYRPVLVMKDFNEQSSELAVSDSEISTIELEQGAVAGDATVKTSVFMPRGPEPENNVVYGTLHNDNNLNTTSNVADSNVGQVASLNVEAISSDSSELTAVNARPLPNNPTEITADFVDKLVMYNIQQVAAQGWLGGSRGGVSGNYVDRSRTINNYNTQMGSEISGATQGSILFVDADQALAQDNTNFNWDDTTNRLNVSSVAISGLAGSGTKCLQTDNSGVISVAADVCGAGGSPQTPWTSDIDADGFDVNDLSNLLFRETTGAPTGTDVGLYRDNSGDLSVNVLTGTSINLQVAGADEYNFSATELNVNNNAITNASSYNGLVVTPNTGVITTGTWNGNVIGVSYGGTGVATLTSNGVLYGNGTGAVQATGQGGANSVLVANGGVPSFSSAITVGTSVTSPTINATSALQLGGVDINTAGTLTNVAYENQANVFTVTQTITPAANTNALAVTGFSLTGANTQAMLDLSGTWNTSGTPTAIKLDITDTSSNVASLLVDLKVDASSKFTVNKSGNIFTTGTAVANGNITSGADITASSSGALQFNGSTRLGATSNGNLLISNAAQNNFGLLHFGGSSNSFPALKRSGTGLQVRLSDDSAYTTIDASGLLVGGANINTAGTLTNVAYENQANVFSLDQTISKVDPALVLLAPGNDTDFWLGVTDDGANDDDDLFQIGDGLTPGTNPFFTLNTSGNIGIGTADPTQKLEVVTNATSSDASSLVVKSGSGTGSYIALRPFASDFGATLAYNLSFDGTNNNRVNTSYAGFTISSNLGAATPVLQFDYVAAGANPATTSTGMVLTHTGNVGIGDVSPAALLTVGSGDLFQVNSSGAIAAATGITSSGTIQFSSLTTNGALYTSGGNGTLTTTAPTSGTIGYWSRSGTLLTPTTSGDTLSVPGAGANSERFGSGSLAAGSNSVAIGNTASAATQYSVAIGRNVTAQSGDGVIAIGYNISSSPSHQGIMIGYQANNTGAGVVLGGSASATGGGTAIGYLSSAANSDALALGSNATAFAGAIAIGQGSSTAANGAIAIGGTSASAGHSGAIVVGYGATSTAANQLIFGGPTYYITDVYYGKGVTNSTPVSTTLNATGGSGTDIAGADIILGAGKGTGNAQSGDILFQTSTAGSSGTTLQTLATRMMIDGSNGNVGIGTTAPGVELEVGKISDSSNNVIRVLTDESYDAGFEAYTDGQGDAYLYIGQTDQYGGGLFYNGATGATPHTVDAVSFYRRDAGTDTEVFHYLYNDSDVIYSGGITLGQYNGSARNTNYGLGVAYASEFQRDVYMATTSGNVGIATTAPDKALEINSADGNNLRLTYNDSNGTATNYADLLMSSGGDLTIAPSGGDTNITGNLAVSGNANATQVGVGGTYMSTNSGNLLLSNWNSIHVPSVRVPAAVNNLTLATASATAMMSFDQRTTTSGLSTMTLTGLAPTIASSSTAEYNTGVFTAPTITLTGTTQVTSQMDSFLFNQPTITNASANTVDRASTLTISGAPVKAGSVSLTNTYALKVEAGAVSTATNSYGLYVDAQTGATNNYAAIFNGGNVGIGTSSPTYRMTISADNNTFGDALYVYRSGAPSSSPGVRIEEANASSNSIINFRLNGAGGSNYILGNAAGTFVINPGNTPATTSFSINSSGSVGINTSGPDRKLDVLDASNPQLRLTQTDGTVYSDFQMNSSGDLLMNVDGISNQLVLDNGGNVGIGTAAPSQKLHVNGSIHLTRTDGGTGGYFSYTSNEAFTFYNNAGSAIPLLASAYSSASGGTGVGMVMGSNRITLGVNTSTLQVISTGVAIGTGFVDGTVPTNGMVVQGNVGVGTTGTDRALEINSATGNNLRLTYNDSNGSATTYADLLTTSAGYLTVTPTGGRSTFNGTSVTTASGNANLIVNSTDTAAADLGGSLGFAQGGTNYAVISGRTDGAGGNPGYMTFATRNGSNVMTEHMRITSGGLVGIGISPTGSPSQGKLHVALTDSTAAAALYANHTGNMGGNNGFGVQAIRTGTANKNYGFYTEVSGTATNMGAFLQAENSATNTASELVRLTSMTSGTAANNIGASMTFYAEDTNGNEEFAGSIAGILTNATHGAEAGALVLSSRSTEGLRIINNGNIGIGTATPGTTAPGWFNSGAKVLEVRSATTSDDIGLFIRRSDAVVGLDIAVNADGVDGYHTYYNNLYSFSDHVFQIAGTEIIRFEDTGNVGIGDNGPDYKLDVEGNSASSYITNFFNDGNADNRYGIQIQAGADDASGTTYYINALDGDGTQVGYISNSSGTFSLVDVSDSRTKTNIENTQLDATAILNGLRVVDFNRLANPDGPKITGFIAQEVQELYPNMVTESENGLLGISKENLIPVLVKGFQDQQAEINNLKTQVSLLQGNLSGNITSDTPIVLYSHLYLTQDSIGQAKILEGATSVRVSFTKPYEYQPIVTITPNSKVGSEYWVADKDNTGFTIYIDEQTNNDVTFDWHVFAGQGTKLTVSDGTTSDIELVVVNDDSGQVLGDSSGSSGDDNLILLPPTDNDQPPIDEQPQQQDQPEQPNSTEPEPPVSANPNDNS